MRTRHFVLLAILSLIVPLVASGRVRGFESLNLTATGNHHVARLNSDQPYVAGFHVDTEDLNTYRTVDGTAVTVSFLLSNVSNFPAGSWLGGGMFLQAQDHRFKHVDYGFYVMLVLDSAGSLFIDLGLHQTREESLPLQTPNEELVYAYTWQVTGIESAGPVTLRAQWDESGFVHYSITVLDENITLRSIRVAELPDCENIIPKFYSGNVIVEPFPFSRYVNYFQFGMVSSERIADSHWNVYLKEPKMLRQNEWVKVDRAWSIQGDISFLDKDWKWGGQPYVGVNAQYFMNPLENLYEIIFSYTEHTLGSGAVLWDQPESGLNETANASSPPSRQALLSELMTCYVCGLSVLVVVLRVNKSRVGRRHSNQTGWQC